MHLTNRVREFLIDQNYYIDIYDHHIHVFHYVDVITLNSTDIVLQMDGFVLKIKGTNFRVQKLETHEILVCGTLESLVIDR